MSKKYVRRESTELRTPVIVDYHCIEHDPIDEWQPADPKDVDLLLTLTIGLDASAGALFYVRVATHRRLSRHSPPDDHTIVVQEFQWDVVLDRVQAILDECRGRDWDDIAEKLSRHMQYEYAMLPPL